jgi:DNA anti-recombination protein RmuC
MNLSSPTPSGADELKQQAKAKAEEVKQQGQAKADQVKQQAQVRFDEFRQQAKARADEVTQQPQSLMQQALAKLPPPVAARIEPLMATAKQRPLPYCGGRSGDAFGAATPVA